MLTHQKPPVTLGGITVLTHQRVGLKVMKSFSPGHPEMSKAPSSPRSWVVWGQRDGIKSGKSGGGHTCFLPDIVLCVFGQGSIRRGGRSMRRQRRKGSGSKHTQKAKKIKGPRENNSLGSYCALAQTLWLGDLNRYPSRVPCSHQGACRGHRGSRM